MDILNAITLLPKYKHLTFEHYDYIIREIIKHDAFHNGKKRNTGRTTLIPSPAITVGTSVSNIYCILKDASITVIDSNLISRVKLSATAAFNKRAKVYKPSSISMLNKAQRFIKLVVDEVKSNTLSSIDETANYLKLHQQDKIPGMLIVCTITIYNYLHQEKIELKPIDLPRMTRRKKTKTNYKDFIPKRQKAHQLVKDHLKWMIEANLDIGRVIW